MKYCMDCNKPKSNKGTYCKEHGYKHRSRPIGLKYIKCHARYDFEQFGARKEFYR